MPLASLSDIDAETAKTYACRDADGTARLHNALVPRVSAMGLNDVYRLELSTYHFIDRMMMIGIKPDLDIFSTLSTKLRWHIEELQVELDDMVDEGFNANSHDQVREHIFGKLGLPEMKRTPGGEASTNDVILEGLEREYGVCYPEIPLIREYRETYKLKNTFVDRIPDYANRWPFDGRIHCTFRTTRVVTGRLAASDPNLLAQPEHGQFANDFKLGWVAEDGHVFVSADESQIELRVLAHLSRDPVLLAAYRDGVDLHARLAVRVFGGTEQDHKEGNGRLAAKAINFGIPMGMQAQGLTLQLRKNGVMVDEDDAQRWLNETNGLYKGVVRYKDERIAEARRNGYVRCLSGRIRYIGGIHSWDRAVKAEAERYAFSTPIQEGAQWIVKQAEHHLWGLIRKMWTRGIWVEPLLQVHDAIKLEVEEGYERDVNDLMRYAMVDAVGHNLCIPLEIDSKWGYNMAPATKHDKTTGAIIFDNDRGLRGF